MFIQWFLDCYMVTDGQDYIVKLFYIFLQILL